MQDWLDIILIFLGSSFVLISAIGLLRMPDIMIRMHAATKAGTLGVGFMMLAVAAHFSAESDTLSTFVRVVAIIVFLFATAPVAAHLIARSAYLVGVKLWRVQHDDLRQHYETGPREKDNDIYDPIVFGNLRRNRVGQVVIDDDSS